MTDDASGRVCDVGLGLGLVPRLQRHRLGLLGVKHDSENCVSQM